MGLFGPSVERKTQLYFRDDNKFQFVKRPLEYSCLVEKDGDTLKKAWKHFYGNQLPFPGYKRIPADVVTLGYNRDIILDPFEKVPMGEETTDKPKRDKNSLRAWIAQIAENQRYIFRAKRESTFLADRISWALIGVLFIMLVFWGIKFAWG